MFVLEMVDGKRLFATKNLRNAINYLSHYPPPLLPAFPHNEVLMCYHCYTAPLLAKTGTLVYNIVSATPTVGEKGGTHRISPSNSKKGL